MIYLKKIHKITTKIERRSMWGLLVFTYTPELKKRALQLAEKIAEKNKIDGTINPLDIPLHTYLKKPNESLESGVQDTIMGEKNVKFNELLDALNNVDKGLLNQSDLSYLNNIGNFSSFTEYDKSVLNGISEALTTHHEYIGIVDIITNLI